MDSRLLPQNKVLVSSDQLSKFCYFAWKSVPTIRALSLRMQVKHFGTELGLQNGWRMAEQRWKPRPLPQALHVSSSLRGGGHQALSKVVGVV